MGEKTYKKLLLFLFLFCFQNFKTMGRLVSFINQNNITNFKVVEITDRDVFDVKPKYQKMYCLIYEVKEDL